MKLTWKKDAQETGLRSIGAKPRGSKLHDGVKTYATVNAFGGGWQGEVKGWYYVAGWDSGIPYVNTCQTPNPTESEAKIAAKAYVLAQLKAQELKV